MTLFDINKIIHIDLKSCNIQQIFMISQYYELNFENIVNFKNDNYDRIYVQVTDGALIAYSKPVFKLHDKYSKGITKEDFIKLMKLKPCKVTRILKEEKSVDPYLFFLKKGYDIKTPSLDRKIEELRNSPIKPFYKVDSKVDSKVETTKTKVKTEVKSKVDKDTFNVDKILDKINKGGVDSITKEEKEFLDNLYS